MNGPAHVTVGTGTIGLTTLDALRRRGEQVWPKAQPTWRPDHSRGGDASLTRSCKRSAGADGVGSVDAAAVAAVATMPVQTQHGGVVTQASPGRIEDAVGQCSNRLARVKHPRFLDRLP